MQASGLPVAILLSCRWPGEQVFDFNKRELLILAVCVIVAVVLGIYGAFSIARYLAADNPNDPLAKIGGLNPVQERALRAK